MSIFHVDGVSAGLHADVHAVASVLDVSVEPDSVFFLVSEDEDLPALLA
jgi:hypothetical protein